MKRVLSLLVFVSVVYTTIASAEYRSSCDGYYDSGWSECSGPVYTSSSSCCGSYDDGYSSYSSYIPSVSYSSSSYYQPRSESYPYYRDSSGRRYVDVDGVLYRVSSQKTTVQRPAPSTSVPRYPQAPSTASRRATVPQAAPLASAPKYTPVPSTASRQPNVVGQSASDELPAPKNGSKRSNGLLSNPTREETQRTRYPGVEFFKRD